MPLDQGILATCYLQPNQPIGHDELLDKFQTFYADEPFINVVDAPPGVRDVRDTNFAAIHPAVEQDTGRILVFCAIDNLWKGASGAAVQNLNLMLGLDERAGLLEGQWDRVAESESATIPPLFESRWTELPDGVTENGSNQRPACSPRGRSRSGGHQAERQARFRRDRF